MPVGRSGERGIEFDIISGQDVQLNTDLMEMLHTNMLNSSGVPSVIMNYINEADYAKTLVMANSKFLSRVISYQIDFNVGLTDLYRKLIKFSKISTIDENRLNDFYYVLNKPKTLNTTNSNDLISNADQVAMAIVKILTGENAEQTDEDNKVKDLLYKEVIKDMLPMFDWNKLQETYENAKVESAKQTAIKKANEDSSGGDSY